MKKLAPILFIGVLFMIISCNNETNQEYFYDINEKLNYANNDQRKISSLYLIELKKFNQSKNKKYQLSSKYVESFLYPENKPKRISLLYELLKINDNKYTFLTIACKYYLAIEVEKISPVLCFHFLNDAIQLEELSQKKTFLPQLYKLKGKWNYDQQNYTDAQNYYLKSLKFKNDLLFTTSVYNALGLNNLETGNCKLSIEYLKKGIDTLEKKKNLRPEENSILNQLKGNLGIAYYKNKEYDKAENVLWKCFLNYSKNKENNALKEFDSKIPITLFNLYSKTKNIEKEKFLAYNLSLLLSDIKSTKTKIEIGLFLQNFYIQQGNSEYSMIISEKLGRYTIENTRKRATELYDVSQQLNEYIIKNIDQKFDYKIKSHKTKIIILLLLLIISIISFMNFLNNLIRKNNIEKESLESEKCHLENNLRYHRNKIKNLRLNLNLKTETEKAFLENLKKIKKEKDIDFEVLLKELQFKIMSLIQIDERNSKQTINESVEEYDAFIQKISSKFPDLSPNELKLCVFFRLKLTSKEISILENITPGSVRVYKTKIKNKMQLERSDELSNYLNTI
ncbi:hypothetical protein [Chryseobacterium sp. MMS23-Vi53]|uniref:hypothetical protein n=1 Tax=Chryseobacterium sp. MMS23-Vi53 TaxID=3386644 RepID=UPI0039ECA50E